jgi:hypothetical protein
MNQQYFDKKAFFYCNIFLSKYCVWQLPKSEQKEQLDNDVFGPPFERNLEALYY